MRSLSPTHLVVAVAALAMTGACTPSRGFCEAHADCELEVLGIVIPDQAGNAEDSVGVCVVELDGQLRALRANEEQECIVAAEKQELFMACVANAFAAEKDGCEAIQEDCEDELDDFQDALADIDGNECGSNED